MVCRLRARGRPVLFLCVRRLERLTCAAFLNGTSDGLTISSWNDVARVEQLPANLARL